MTTTRRVGAKTGALNLICQDRGNTRKTRGGEASPKARRRTNMEQSPLEVWEKCVGRIEDGGRRHQAQLRSSLVLATKGNFSSLGSGWLPG